MSFRVRQLRSALQNQLEDEMALDLSKEIDQALSSYSREAMTCLTFVYSSIEYIDISLP